jgi:hypothetical protein
MYLVKYYGGEWDSAYQIDLFVTESEQAAINYVAKFNTMLEKWLEYYDKQEEYSDKWSRLSDISCAAYEEVKVR